jgi:hypothetical protein
VARRRDELGNICLHLARHASVVEVLLSLGSDPCARNHGGQRPADYFRSAAAGMDHLADYCEARAAKGGHEPR